MNDLSLTKKLLRKELQSRRNSFISSLSSSNSSKLYNHFAAQLQEYLKKNNIPNGTYIAGFIPIRSEIDILQVLKQFENQYHFCLPVHERSEKMKPLLFRQFSKNLSKEQLVVGEYGILIPPESAQIVIPNLILTPFLGFDPITLHRIGYGGGHFDRTIQQFKLNSQINNQINPKFIGVGFDCQIVNEIPSDESDYPLDAIITENRIYF